MRQLLSRGMTVLLLTGICFIDCGAKKKHEQPAEPKFTEIQNISVLPIVDARAGEKAKVNLGTIQDLVVHSLKHRRYSADAAATSGEAGEVAIEDVESALPAYIKKLGPADARWVMVVFLNDVNSPGVKGALLPGWRSSNAELTGYLFDKDAGALVWKDTGIGRRRGQSDMFSFERSETVSLAIAAMLGSIPDHPKPDK